MSHLLVLWLMAQVQPAVSPQGIALPAAPQRALSEPLDPVREARVQKLGKLLRCAVCQGLSIADSPASMARAQLDRVRDLVADGKSDEEIMQYFVARYGEWILLKPIPEGMNLVVWLGPLVLLAVGGAVIWAQKRKKTLGPVAAVVTGPASEDAYLQAVRRELDR